MLLFELAAVDGATLALRLPGVCAARGHLPPLRAANADYLSAVSDGQASTRARQPPPRANE